MPMRTGLSKSKVLVTGGAGYCGSHTVIALHQAGYLPVVADNFLTSSPQMLRRLRSIMKQPLPVYKGDCGDRRFLDDLFDREKTIHAVIHFAACKSVRESMVKPLLYYRNNIGAMAGILGAVKDHQVSRFIFSSSCAVYGRSAGLPVSEKATLSPGSPYGFTKYIGEKMIEDVIREDRDIRAISLRYFNPVGAHSSGMIGERPETDYKNLIPLLLESVDRGKELTIFGRNYATEDGTCVRDYIHVMDVAAAHVKALTYLHRRKGRGFHEVFNLGSGHGHSVLEIIRLVEKVTGRKVRFRFGPRASGDVDTVYADARKARRLLKWKPQFGVEDALRHAWSWQQSVTY